LPDDIYSGNMILIYNRFHHLLLIITRLSSFLFIIATKERLLSVWLDQGPLRVDCAAVPI